MSQSNYSIGGYILALGTRSTKTLLVEGDTDVKILHRIRAQLELNSSPMNHPRVGSLIAIDSADIIKDQLTEGRGNKQKVIETARRAASNPKIDRKFRALVDKEWDDFSLHEKSRQEESNIQNLSNILSTRGHSIENYGFAGERLVSFFLRHYPEKVTPSLRAALDKAIPSMLQAAFCISWACKESRCIQRANDMMCRKHFRMEADILKVDREAVTASLRERGASEEAISQFVASWGDIEERFSNEEITLEIAQWMSHGHLGEDVFWAAVSQIAYNEGFSEDDALQIERGHRNEKIKDYAEYLCRLPKDYVSPIVDLVDWGLAEG